MPDVVTAAIIAGSYSLIVLAVGTVIGWYVTHRSQSAHIEQQAEENRKLQTEKAQLEHVLATERADHQAELDRSRDVRQLTLPPKLEDLGFVYNWAADGLRIGRKYVQIALTDKPYETWKRNEYRNLVSERREWSSRFSECYRLAFRLDPSRVFFYAEGDDELHLPEAVESISKTVELIKVAAYERDKHIDGFGEMLRILFDIAQKESARIKKESFEGL